MRDWLFLRKANKDLSKKKSESPDFQEKVGGFKFRFQQENGGSVEDSLELSWKDFNEHLLITGGSGSGKTSTVLLQIYEGLVFRAGFHSERSIRQRAQVGGLVIEAKGDFTPKTQRLAQRYQREESIVYFGPEHPESVYDPFGDPDELPLQKAHKINELIKAANSGKEGGDPFWSQASQKWMTSVFILHDHLLKAGVPIPAISFPYLNLLCLDRHQNDSSEMEVMEQFRQIRESFRSIRRVLEEIQEEWEGVQFEEDESRNLREQLLLIQTKIRKMQGDHSQGFDNHGGKWILNELDSTRESWSRTLRLLPLEAGQRLRRKKTLLFEQVEEIQFVWRKLAQSLSEKKESGTLTKLLDQYVDLLKKRGESLESDWIYNYFKNEYFNPVNEKTSASIAMVVSNALMPFVTAPLNRMFAPEGTFNFRKVIDAGDLVVLDMPSAQYGVAQRFVSLVLKIDFFRMTLNRPRLIDIQENRLVNQERDLIYLCDEFGTIATSGDQTGEASFLDKVREYRCSCILAMQGVPSLLRKIPEMEVETLLQNCGIKIFLRNDDPKTNDYASRALGSEIKVRLNQNQGATEHWMDSQKKWGARSYSTSYERSLRYSSDHFVSLRVGEGVLRLPARFGAFMVRQVRFDFNPIHL